MRDSRYLDPPFFFGTTLMRFSFAIAIAFSISATSGCTQYVDPPPRIVDYCDGTDEDGNGLVDDGAFCEPFGGTAACIDGECVITSCSADRSDCDGRHANGCEIQSKVEASGCGETCVVCESDELCSEGVCVAAGVMSVGGPGDQRATQVVDLGDGSVAIAGTADARLVLGDFTREDATLDYAFVWALSSSRSSRWAVAYDVPGFLDKNFTSTRVSALAAAPDGGVYFGGEFRWSITDGVRSLAPEGREAHSFLARVDAEGTPERLLRLSPDDPVFPTVPFVLLPDSTGVRILSSDRRDYTFATDTLGPEVGIGRPAGSTVTRYGEAVLLGNRLLTTGSFHGRLSDHPNHGNSSGDAIYFHIAADDPSEEPFLASYDREGVDDRPSSLLALEDGGFALVSIGTPLASRSDIARPSSVLAFDGATMRWSLETIVYDGIQLEEVDGILYAAFTVSSGKAHALGNALPVIYRPLLVLASIDASDGTVLRIRRLGLRTPVRLEDSTTTDDGMLWLVGEASETDYFSSEMRGDSDLWIARMPLASLR